MSNRSPEEEVERVDFDDTRPKKRETVMRRAINAVADKVLPRPTKEEQRLFDIRQQWTHGLVVPVPPRPIVPKPKVKDPSPVSGGGSEEDPL
jgi:hypothetical protein